MIWILLVKIAINRLKARQCLGPYYTAALSIATDGFRRIWFFSSSFLISHTDHASRLELQYYWLLQADQPYMMHSCKPVTCLLNELTELNNKHTRCNQNDLLGFWEYSCPRWRTIDQFTCKIHLLQVNENIWATTTLAVSTLNLKGPYSVTF